MDNSDLLSFAFATSLRYWPLLVLAGVGLWFARSRRHALGRAGFWASWGFGLLIGYSFAAYGSDFAFRLEMLDLGTSTTGDATPSRMQLAAKHGYLQLAARVPYIVGLAFVASAVFVGRGANPSVVRETGAA